MVWRAVFNRRLPPSSPKREKIDSVDASDLTRFVRRDWSVLAELKADYWASMKARVSAALRSVQAVRRS